MRPEVDVTDWLPRPAPGCSKAPSESARGGLPMPQLGLFVQAWITPGSCSVEIAAAGTWDPPGGFRIDRSGQWFG